MHILIRISLILKAGVAKNTVLELMNGVYVWVSFPLHIKKPMFVLPGDSIVNQLSFLYNTFCQALDSGKEVRAVFCDISKAFDRV